MGYFPRPAGAIEDVNTLKLGDVLYHVYGIWPPSLSAYPETVVRTALAFKHHPEYHDGSSQGELLAFDTECVSFWNHKEYYRRMHFASDCNMEPGHSHNDNYWFRSKEEAEAAVTFLYVQWKARPDLIEEVKEWRERERAAERHYSSRGEYEG